MTEPARVITVTVNTAIDRVLRVPGFKVGGHLQAESVSDCPAGKGINVSRALTRLGRSSVATGFVGDRSADHFAAITHEDGSEGRIDNQLIPVPGATRENITVIDPQAGTDTHLRTQGFTVTRDDLTRLEDMITRLTRPDDLLVFAGSLPPGMDIEALNRLVHAANTRGGRIVLDLSGPELIHAIMHVGTVWMASPNRKELMDALSMSKDVTLEKLLTAARTLASRTDRVLLSLGADGAALITGDEVYRGTCPVPSESIANTVGAGDCLLAAALDASLAGMTPEQILCRSTAVAAANIQSPETVGFVCDQVRELARTARAHKMDPKPHDASWRDA